MKLLPFLAGICIFLLTACQEPTSYPRPKAYPRIDIPSQTTHKTFQTKGCPFTFEYPESAQIKNLVSDSCVMDLYFSDHDFIWHMTYRDVKNSGKSRLTHSEEHRKLVMKHITKLSHLQEREMATDQGKGIQYALFGQVGTPSAFSFGNDDHMLMTSFYFSKVVNQDSLKPLIDYVKSELEYTATSIRWDK